MSCILAFPDALPDLMTPYQRRGPPDNLEIMINITYRTLFPAAGMKCRAKHFKFPLERIKDMVLTFASPQGALLSQS